MDFFGLTQEYKKSLHEIIFSVIYHGNGGFTYQDLYNMPVFLRNFYIQQLHVLIETENEKKSGKKVNSGKKTNKSTKAPSKRRV